MYTGPLIVSLVQLHQGCLAATSDALVCIGYNRSGTAGCLAAYHLLKHVFVPITHSWCIEVYSSLFSSSKLKASQFLSTKSAEAS